MNRATQTAVLSLLALILAVGCKAPGTTAPKVRIGGTLHDVALLTDAFDDVEKESAPFADCVIRPRFGSFLDERRSTPVGSGRDERLDAPFRFQDKRGVGTLWTAPMYSLSQPWLWNGSSIPRVLWPLLGGPKSGCHAPASVIHDYLYQRANDHRWSRKACDRMYYDGARANGLGRTRAKLMYYGLRLGGAPNFQRRGSSLDAMWSMDALTEEQQLQHLGAVNLWIESADPDLDELDALLPDDPRLLEYTR